MLDQPGNISMNIGTDDPDLTIMTATKNRLEAQRIVAAENKSSASRSRLARDLIPVLTGSLTPSPLKYPPRVGTNDVSKQM